MPSEHDITIYFANKPTYNRFKVALEIQDACNMRAIAREFVKVVDTAIEAARTEGRFETYHSDPAIVLLLNKLESMMATDDFSKAYDACEAKAIPTALDFIRGEGGAS